MNSQPTTTASIRSDFVSAGFQSKQCFVRAERLNTTRDCKWTLNVGVYRSSVSLEKLLWNENARGNSRREFEVFGKHVSMRDIDPMERKRSPPGTTSQPEIDIPRRLGNLRNNTQTLIYIEISATKVT